MIISREIICPLRPEGRNGLEKPGEVELNRTPGIFDAIFLKVRTQRPRFCLCLILPAADDKCKTAGTALMLARVPWSTGCVQAKPCSCAQPVNNRAPVNKTTGSAAGKIFGLGIPISPGEQIYMKIINRCLKSTCRLFFRRVFLAALLRCSKIFVKMFGCQTSAFIERRGGLIYPFHSFRIKWPGGPAYP